MTRIALFQSNTGIDPDANARALERAIGEAAGGGAEMLFTPEMSGLLDRDSERAAKNLRSEEQDEVLAACREAAKRHGIWLHIGSLAVVTPNGKVANRAFVIDREGKIRARYDKLHLFDVDLPTGESWRESSVYSAGGSFSDCLSQRLRVRRRIDAGIRLKERDPSHLIRSSRRPSRSSSCRSSQPPT